jgi:hypothetical protein
MTDDDRDPGLDADRAATRAVRGAGPATGAADHVEAASGAAPAAPGTAEPAPPGTAEPAPPGTAEPAVVASAPRPLVERVGMAAIAAVLAILFAGVGAAAFLSGEPFLGIMAGIGAVMTAWVGALTLVRG